jgi:hypothetical protein
MICSNPRTKKDLIKMLNDRYRDYVSFGKISDFYELGLHKSKNLATFRAINRQMINFRWKSKKRGKIYLNLHDDITFSSHDDTSERNVIQIESILEFEHTMRTLQLKVCKSCREYRLQFDDTLIIAKTKHAVESLNHHFSNKTKLMLCSECKRKGFLTKKGKDYYKESNLLPVWYEKKADGSFLLDSDGNKVMRYDVPEELTSLTMAEKLLIRRCAPFVPLVHVATGVTGLKGHCVCYHQDITEMCKVLPHRKEEIITFIRKVGGHDTRGLTSHIDAFKVRRSKILDALQWLKMHNVHYHDIDINTSNLDWMNDAEEAVVPSTVHEHSFVEDPKNYVHDFSKETVSYIQTEAPMNQNGGIEYCGVNIQSTPFTASSSQEESMKKIKKTVICKGSGEGLMHFPSIDDYDPIS